MRKPGRPSGADQQPGGRIFFWLSVGIVILLLGSAWLGRDGYLAVIVNSERVSELQREIAAIEATNKKLRAEIRSLRSDMEAIERIAREDLGLVKEGEIVYEFAPSKK